MEYLDVTVSAIVEIEVASFSCGKLQHIEGLPGPFIQAKDVLTLAKKALRKIQQVLRSSSFKRQHEKRHHEDESTKALRSGLHECLQLVRSTNAMFLKIRDADILSPGPSDWSAIVDSYRQIVVPLGKLHKVETLMLNLLVELRILLLNDELGYYHSLYEQDQELADACKWFAKVLPSLPATGSSKPPTTTLTKSMFKSEGGVSKNQASQTSTQNTTKSHHWTGLLWAMQRGRTDLVQILLEKDGINPGHKDANGRTLLSLAVAGHDAAIPRLLLEYGSDMEASDNTGRTPLSWAAQNGSREVVSLLLGGEIESQDDTGRTPLSWAVGQGNFKVVTLLLDAGGDLKSRDDTGRTPLSWAAEKGNSEVVTLLLDKGGNVESRDNTGRTPLSWAAEQGDSTLSPHQGNNAEDRAPLLRGYMIKSLLDRGSDVESRDNDGRTPLSWAAESGFRYNTEILLERGSDIDSRDNSGRTPLSWAAGNGREDTIKYLWDRGSDIESRDNTGRTPISWAVEGESHTVIRCLLDCYCDIKSRDDTGRTPLSWAAEKGNEAILSVLFGVGIKVDLADETGRTPLSWAAEQGQKEAVSRLLHNDANANFKDKNGRTPLIWAVVQGHDEVVDQLLEPKTNANLKENNGWLSDNMDKVFTAELVQPAGTTLNVDFHQTSCAHKPKEKDEIKSTGHQSSDLRAQHLRRANMQDQLSLLCGLAGVFPPGSPTSSQTGQASFSAGSASIIFTDRMENSKPLDGLLLQLKTAVGGLIAGATYVQQSAFCCNQFTVLTTSQHGLDQQVVRMNTVPFDRLVELHRSIEKLGDELNDTTLLQSVSISTEILSSLFDMVIPMPLSVEPKLHYCSLTVQLLCLGLVLYSRAHVEGFHPIYLAEPLDEVILHGSSPSPDQAHITVEQCELACMGDMVGGKVFVFNFRTTPQSFLVETEASSSHLSATCEEIVDCWGPGLLLFADPAVISEEKISGVVIRGGIIGRLNNGDDVFHWGGNAPEAELDLAGSFSYRERLVIGAGIDAVQGSTVTMIHRQAPQTQTSASQNSLHQPRESTQQRSTRQQPTQLERETRVKPNGGCGRDYSKAWKRAQVFRSTLGATSSTWAFTERSAALQFGNQVVGQFGLTQTKQPGIPAKRTILDRWSNERKLSLLEELHGIQVSLCSGVARRVPLRVLIRDDLMDYLRSLTMNGWEQLEEEANIAMSSRERFRAWASGLNGDKKACMGTAIDKLLFRLKDTGFDKNGTCFAVMWPNGSDGRYCVRLQPTGADTRCRMFKDTEWSTTFAVATKICLVAPSFRCNGGGTDWEGMNALSTFMFYREPEVKTKRRAEAWQIRDGERYWNGEKASEVMFVARKTPNEVTELVLWGRTHLMPKALRFLWPSREVLVEINDMEQSGEEVLIA